jgi:Fe(3+) dicitrate transport protein
LILYVSVYQSIAQTIGTVEGNIKDQTGTNLIGVDVFIDGLKKGTASGADGNFKLTSIPVGKYVVRVSSVGYESFSQTVEIGGNGTGLPLQIQLKDALYVLPEIIIARETMTGGSQFIKDIPGSAHYISPKELNKYSYSDINRILRNIPGINIQEEDGFGLRPNIGMRGTGLERSSKITIMEDGILAAPAPYVAPSAYYFPTVGRMQGVEVRKGSSQIKYGPYTTGGAINFLSSPIPQDFLVRVNLMGGKYGRRIAQASVGQSYEHGGFMIETYQNSATGFKELDNGGPTGFYNQDYLAKFRINTAADSRIYQSLTFKIGQAKGDSDETYLGLTQEDFDATPYRRYSASQMDIMATSHQQYSIKYNIIPAKFLDISLTGYRNNFSRNWYKLNSVKYNPNADPSAKSVGIADVLDSPLTYADEYALLTGTTSPNEDALSLRNNNRKYYAQGFQSIIGLNFDSGTVKHDIEVGFRYHEDEEDRFQWDDQYRMRSGTMQMTEAGLPGTQDNRVANAYAFASYVQYSLNVGKFHALPGVRFEDMEITRTDYGKTDPGRTGSTMAKSSNHVSVWIPGIGFEYQFTSSVRAFGGIHRGFAPPGSKEGTDPEMSINYEFGARMNNSQINAQAIVFYNDYQNLLGSDLAAAGGGGTGDQFNAGNATIYGTEVELSYVFVPSSSLNLPISLNYTFTHGEFGSSFNAENEDWGTVQVGDALPYLAENQLTINLGLENKFFDVNLSSKYVGEMRTSPGTGAIEAPYRINRNFVIDLATNIRVSRLITAFGSINNITDSKYLVARRPAGLRPGLPRTFLAGIKVNL